MSNSSTKIRAVRAYVGLAIKNLNCLSASDKTYTGIEDEIHQAEMALAVAYRRLSEQLAREQEHSDAL